MQVKNIKAQYPNKNIEMITTHNKIVNIMNTTKYDSYLIDTRRTSIEEFEENDVIIYQADDYRNSKKNFISYNM